MEKLEKQNPKLYDDVCQIIEGTRSRIAASVNSEVMHWRIGKRIKEDVLHNKWAAYRKEVVKSLANKLTERYGKGWSMYKLQHCVRSAYTFTENEIRYAVRKFKKKNQGIPYRITHFNIKLKQNHSNPIFIEITVNDTNRTKATGANPLENS